MRRAFRYSFLALALSFLAAPLPAQEIRPLSRDGERAGFWWGLGLGGGRTAIDCSYCTAGPERFPMLQLSAGIALNRTFAIGVQAAGGAKHNAYNGPSDNTATFGDMNVSAYWYPLPTGDLWLQGGVSRVLWRITKDPVDSNTNHSIANGLTAGVGYDLGLGRRMSITPSIRAVWGGKGELVDEQDDVSIDVDWQTTIVYAGVSLTWH